MNADDFTDFLKRVKAAEDIGLTSAEVWRARDERDEEANSRCKRCRKAIDYQAQYCYECTAAIWPGEME